MTSVAESVDVNYLYNIPSVTMAHVHAHLAIMNLGTRIYAFHVSIKQDKCGEYLNFACSPLKPRCRV